MRAEDVPEDYLDALISQLPARATAGIAEIDFRAAIAAVYPLIARTERDRTFHDCLTACMSEYLACMHDAEDDTHENIVAKLKSSGGQDAVWKAMQAIRAIRAQGDAPPPNA